jgi:acyl dehydratase
MNVQWQELDSPPPLPGLYRRAALRRHISGTDLPHSGLRCWVDIEPGRLAAYRAVCGFSDSPLLPPTYPHILAFSLQMQLLTAPAFPFPLLGLIHLSNSISVLRPLGGLGRLHLGVSVENLQPHAKGATFDLITQADDQLGPLWQARSRLLCRGVALPGTPLEPSAASAAALSELTRWPAPAGIGRRYARVSGDYNPIHLSGISARLFGFPQAIAHGLWNKARTLAALAEHLPAANLEIAVDFHKPVRLPSEVILHSSAPGSSGELRLAGSGGLEHMRGQWRPVG